MESGDQSLVRAPASLGPTVCAGYRLLVELGHGGTGIVFGAQHERSGRRVALKLLRPELSQSRQAVARFFHEARSASSVIDPGIVEMYDSGYADDGSAFIVMEWLEGESLGAYLGHASPVSLAMLRYIGMEIARIVGAAHARQIIHRDLKPDNVFLVHDTKQPFGVLVKVLDFGMAKLNPDEGPYSFVTDKGALLGTPLYMAPEQCRGEPVDPRSDIYALGCMLYELACGRPPFVRGSLGLILGAHVYEPVQSARALVPTLPQALDELLLRSLAKRREHRQQTMLALSLELATLSVR